MIKHLLKSTLLLATLTMGSNAADIMLDPAKLNEIKANTKTLQQPTLTLKEGIDKDSVYFLKIEAKSQRGSRVITAFVDKKTGATYFGRGFDKDGKQMAFAKDTKLIKDAITFSYGSGKKELYLLTDPECPYCVKFEQYAKGKLDDYRVHVILYPLPFHKKAPAMVEWVLQGKDDAEKRERFEAVTVGKSQKYTSLIKDEKKPFVYSPKAKESVEKAKQAFVEFGARGTPATYGGDFNPIPRSKLFTK